MDILDVTYGIINWKIVQRPGSNSNNSSETNKNIIFAIDMYLILLEEAIYILDKK